MFMHAAISIPPTYERQYPDSSHPKGHSWGHISPGTPGSSEEMLSSPMNTLEVPGVSCTRDAVVIPGASAGDVCSEDTSKKH